MTGRPVPPAQARELAAAAAALARQIAATDAALRADGDEHRRQAGFRLGDVAGECRRVAATAAPGGAAPGLSDAQESHVVQLQVPTVSTT